MPPPGVPVALGAGVPIPARGSAVAEGSKVAAGATEPIFRSEKVGPGVSTTPEGGPAEGAGERGTAGGEGICVGIICGAVEVEVGAGATDGMGVSRAMGPVDAIPAGGRVSTLGCGVETAGGVVIGGGVDTVGGVVSTAAGAGAGVWNVYCRMRRVGKQHEGGGGVEQQRRRARSHKSARSAEMRFALSLHTVQGGLWVTKHVISRDQNSGGGVCDSWKLQLEATAGSYCCKTYHQTSRFSQ